MTMNIKNILVVDDEQHIRIALFKYISKEGYNVITAATIDEANEKIKIKDIDFAIIDLHFVGGSEKYGGKRIIENVNKLKPLTKIIILSGHIESEEMHAELQDLQYNAFISKGGTGNYITNVLYEIKRLSNEQILRKCFVIMPFSQTKSHNENQWTDIFQYVIKPAVESDTSYICARNEHHFGGIIQNIMRNLNSADLVIADLTDRNANVFYELGVRHTLNTPTIMITQNFEDIPSDLINYMCIKYDPSAAGAHKLMKEIKKAIEEIDSTRGQMNYSPVGDYLQLKT